MIQEPQSVQMFCGIRIGETMNDKTGRLCVTTEYSILDAIKVLDETHERIVLIVEEDRLLGVLTDSDVRKSILRGQDMSEKVTEIMTTNPICVTPGTADSAVEIMERHGIDAVPVIDENRKVQDLIFRYETPSGRKKSGAGLNAPVVIMAGGKGTRLFPYTQVLPKPLIPIGNTTILEQVIDSFAEEGCRDFYLSINYKKNLIKAYFQDMEPSYHVIYLEEERFLGTAGSLYLAKDRIRESFFVSNCDILLDISYADVMKFHKEKGNVITMITSLKNYTIPYGVVNIDGSGQVESLSEKPEMNFLVNTGVYVLEPEVLDMIPKERFMHITELIQMCMDQGKKVGVYPVTEKAWEDMGELAGMEEMLRSRGTKE